MSSSDILNYALATGIIILTLAAIIITIFIVLILRDVRKLVRAIQTTAMRIQYWKDEIQSDVIGSVLSLGKHMFKKKTDG